MICIVVKTCGNVHSCSERKTHEPRSFVDISDKAGDGDDDSGDGYDNDGQKSSNLPSF